MFSTRNHSRRRYYRFLAVGLLLFAVADMAFPQMCGEDVGALLPAPVDSTPHFAPASAAAEGHQPLPDDDCFCCCSHIVATRTVHLASLIAPTSATDGLVSVSVPESPEFRFAEPPRV